MNLHGRKLEVLNIHRQNLIDAEYVGCCANCGKAIVNIAEVKDIQTNERFEIGLDCKKQLIDKNILDKMKIELSEWDFKYQSKEYKRAQNYANKFLTLVGNKENELCYDKVLNTITIYDNKLHKSFPGVIGNIVFIESIGYLNKIGLSKFIADLNEKRLIKFH